MSKHSTMTFRQWYAQLEEPVPPLSAFTASKDITEHPLFQGKIFPWLWRVYTQRLSPAGRWFWWTTMIFMSIGSISLDLQLYVPFVYAFALWIVAAIAAGLSRPQVSLTLRYGERVCAGETLPLEIQVTQTGRRTGVNLYVLPNRLPLVIDAVPTGGIPLPMLRQGQTAQVRLGLHCRRRGAYRLHGVRVETDFPLGIFVAQRLFLEDRRLLVSPRFTPMARLDIPQGRRYHPGGVALASTLGDSFEFIGNRDYREGDNVRDIDWRATARLNAPVVREWREEYFLRVGVVLDTFLVRGAGEWKRQDFERAVSVCAAVSDFMARQEYLVDLFAAGPDLYHLTAGRSLAYLDQILDILACVESSPVEPFETLQPEIAEHLSQINTIVCVFLDWNEARRAFVEHLSAEGAGVKVIIIRDAPPSLAPISETDITLLTRAQVDAGLEEL